MHVIFEMALEDGVEPLVADHEVVALAEDPLLAVKDAVQFRAFLDLAAYLGLEDHQLQRAEEVKTIGDFDGSQMRVKQPQQGWIRHQGLAEDWLRPPQPRHPPTTRSPLDNEQDLLVADNENSGMPRSPFRTGRPQVLVSGTPLLPSNLRVFISYAHDSLAHENNVIGLCDVLRRQGIDARIDVPAARQRQDWPLWMLNEFKVADFVLIIASPEYKRRAEGSAPQGEGLGVQWEASLIRNEIYASPRTALQRFVPIVLQGYSADDLPLWLGPYSTTHYTVPDYSLEGTAELVTFLTHNYQGPTTPLEPLNDLNPSRSPPSEYVAAKLRINVLQRLARRSRDRDLSMVHADVRQLLLIGGLGLTPNDLARGHTADSGEYSRIDIEVGFTAIEVRTDLSVSGVRKSAEAQLSSYLTTRGRQTGHRYVGIIADGTEWRCYMSLDEAFHKLCSMTVEPSDPNVNRLLMWLESAIASAHEIEPIPGEIVGRLGVDSPSYALDATELASIYTKNRDLSHVRVKRRMWARLLTTASGTNFTDDDSLFINHTLLVAMAKVIGHAIIGIDINRSKLTAGSIMSGVEFANSQITGVIETDFFDWIVDVPGGERFVKVLARRLARFKWGHVKHDVLKSLYESIIKPETRKQLGEHYTPDWLAEEIVAQCITEPLSQRVLDASCGSGTFLFHAVRRYLQAAEKDGVSNESAIRGVVQHIFGIDVHPVAVTLARVSYLLAIGMNRLDASEHPAFTVPVYLGDSLKWGNEQAIWSEEGLSVPTDENHQTFVNDPYFDTNADFEERLKFPDRVVADAERFDQLVTALADKAAARGKGDPKPQLTTLFASFSIHDEDRAILQRTFENMCDLHDDERDHIWGYYVRNLARPAWLSRPGNRVDVLVGNPPWLAYRFMTEPQQISFKWTSKQRGLWTGASHATSQDLSALFVARCIEQYLKAGGRFGYVMPGGVLALGQYLGFRTGKFNSKTESVKIRFERPWDLHKVKPKIFSQHVCVMLGRRALPDEGSVALSAVPEIWSGRLSSATVSRYEAEACLVRSIGEPLPKLSQGASPYAARFRQGAAFAPRFLFFVQPDKKGPLGAGIGRMAVRSSRSAKEKEPWVLLDDLHERIEQQFVLPAYIGESVLPFRCLPTVEVIVPWDGLRLLDGDSEDLDLYPGLATWWRKAEAIWNRHRSSNILSFSKQADYMGKLSRQLPASPIRVVYNKSGNYLVAAIVYNSSAVIGQQLYWGPVADVDEGRFLTAILNSSYVTTSVQHMQSRGENTARHFAKVPFRLAIPLYDSSNHEHRRLVSLAERAEQLSERAVLPELGFEAQRTFLREELAKEGVGTEIDSFVKTLLA
jgi:SAM-dependent methyltransferase